MAIPDWFFDYGRPLAVGVFVWLVLSAIRSGSARLASAPPTQDGDWRRVGPAYGHAAMAALPWLICLGILAILHWSPHPAPMIAFGLLYAALLASTYYAADALTRRIWWNDEEVVAKQLFCAPRRYRWNELVAIEEATQLSWPRLVFEDGAVSMGVGMRGLDDLLRQAVQHGRRMEALTASLEATSASATEADRPERLQVKTRREDHPTSERALPPLPPNSRYRDAVLKWLEARLGPCVANIEGPDDQTPPIALYLWRPTTLRPYWTMSTIGLSDHAMSTPDGLVDGATLRRIEIMLHLGPDWPTALATGLPSPQSATHGYPFEVLAHLAAFPVETGRWLHAAHTIAFADPPAPLGPTTDASAVALIPALEIDDDATMTAPDGETITFLAAMPIHTDELALAQDAGVATLLERFDAQNAPPWFDPKRPSSLSASRGAFGRLFG